MPCPRFVQNAWKRDLCSNCFKGKEEHAPVVDQTAIYLAKLKEIINLPPPPSILKGAVRKNVSAFKVHFPTEESQVIGYGGDEFSDNEDDQDVSVVDSPKLEEDAADAEEDKKFQQLTESNTEFNKDPANLMLNMVPSKPAEAATKIINTPLKLGQIKSNSDNKKPLLVSVQPFGSPSSETPLSVSRKTHLNNLLLEGAESIKTFDSKDPKPSAPLTSNPDVKSEIETDPDQYESKLTTDNAVTSSVPYVNDVLLYSKIDSIVENSPKIEPKDDRIDDECKNKESEKFAESRLNSLVEGKKSQISRGTILTKSHEQAKTKRYFQLGPVNSIEEIPVAERLYKKLDTNDKINSNNIFSKAKDTISIKTNLQQKNNRNLTNGLFSSKLMKKEFGLQSDLQLTKINSIDYIETRECAIDQEMVKDDEKVHESHRNSLNSPVGFTKISLLDNAVDKDEVLLINGVPAESREMAGEPDGRADSDDLDEPPPELPTTPPPLLTDHIPRPSFLHSIAKEKPKIAVKPNVSENNPIKVLTLDLTQVNMAIPDPSLSPTSRHNLIKRQAPKPPPTPLGETPPKVFECPGSPIEDCRERTSSISPQQSDSSSNSSDTRRSMSLSNETLSAPLVIDKKKGNKMKTTLRKFLRLTSKEEFKCEESGPPPLPPPRPRLEIIHPLDLNKSGVQVLRGDGSLVHKVHSSDLETPSALTLVPSLQGRPSKPPPPPRSQSLDCTLAGDCRPARPPPPMTQRLSDPAINPQPGSHSVYVNLGEVRSSIAPAKPQRSGSLREKDNNTFYQSSTLQMYESFAPECDSNRDKSSLPYYGSETESDICCPYTLSNSFKGSDARTIVHKNLEDNYGAVVVANYEALIQLLEQAQVSQAPQVPTALQPIKTCSNLQWTDFTVDNGGGEVVGERVFLPAVWGQSPVTLCLAPGQARLPASFMPVTQFFDIVASQYLHQDKTDVVQVSVAVLVRQQFMSLQHFAGHLSSYVDVTRESALLMVQIMNCLKTLHTQGSEQVYLSQFVLSRENPQMSPKVCLLPQPSAKVGETVSLCLCALRALEPLSLPDPLAATLRSLLSTERAPSLTQAKSALELWLWGPTQFPASTDAQVGLQRWLDLERARALQSLVVRRPLTLSQGDYCYLSFLTRTNAKVLADALSILDQYAALPR